MNKVLRALLVADFSCIVVGVANAFTKAMKEVFDQLRSSSGPESPVTVEEVLDFDYECPLYKPYAVRQVPTLRPEQLEYG